MLWLEIDIERQSDVDANSCSVTACAARIYAELARLDPTFGNCH
jgi:hypothetical protein